MKQMQETKVDKQCEHHSWNWSTTNISVSIDFAVLNKTTSRSDQSAVRSHLQFPEMMTVGAATPSDHICQ